MGLAEDLGYSASPNKRLLASIASGILVIWFFKVWVQGIGIPIIDSFLSIGLVGVTFTLFATSGVVNGFNLIDGLNGLASFTGISTALALSFIAFEVNQIEIIRFKKSTNYYNTLIKKLDWKGDLSLKNPKI